MARGLGIILLWAAWSSGFDFAQAQDVATDGDARCNAITLCSYNETRMSPLHAAAVVNDDSQQQAVFLDPAQPADAFVPPREYSFTEFLLNEEGDPQARDCAPSTALALALALHDTRLLERLLDRGADPNMAVAQPVAVWLPGLFENAYIARELMKDSRITPLMLAVLSEQTEAVRLLMRHGANTELCTKALHMYPLDFAAEVKNLTIMQLLLGHDPTMDGEGRHVIISLYMQKAWLMVGNQVMFETPVSTGRAGFETHKGEFVITQKYTAWKSTLYKAAMPNFMRLNCGPAGMHSGYVPGVPASHGCIRLPPRNAGIIYGMVKLGDRVSIVE
ncbi:MAG: L,D-transpeptidase family protein [Chthoniobacteraceae bacterium]